jgi:rubrerythrin
LIRKKLEKCKNIKFIEKMISIESSLKPSQLSEIDEMTALLIATMPDENVQKPPQPKEKKKGFVCKICGYVHEAEILPDDFVCPLCHHVAADFEPLS